MDSDIIGDLKAAAGSNLNRIVYTRRQRHRKKSNGPHNDSTISQDVVVVVDPKPPLNHQPCPEDGDGDDDFCANAPEVENLKTPSPFDNAKNKPHHHAANNLVEAADFVVQVNYTNTNAIVLKPLEETRLIGDGVDKVIFKLFKETPNNEILNLSKRLESELRRVRMLVQRLEAKKIQIDAAAASSYTPTPVIIDNNNREGVLMRLNSLHESSPKLLSTDMRNLAYLTIPTDNTHADTADFLEKEKQTPKANQHYPNSKFLLGKDRLPPEKKVKLNNGISRKQQQTFGFTNGKIRDCIFKSCRALLLKLMKHKFGWVFNAPVDAKLMGLVDYHVIIKYPMDLGTIKTRLSQNRYTSPVEFAEDVRLVFRNAMTFNPKGHDVHTMAENFSQIFEERWAVIETKYNPYLNGTMYHDLRTPTSALLPVNNMLARTESFVDPKIHRPHIVRTPVPKKPKAWDLNKRDMTYDEKQKLGSILQGLPSEKLDGVVQIIKKRNTTMSQHDDEIEVDIDNVDAETLWELDRFVLNGTMYHDLHTPTSALLPVKNKLARTESNVDPKIHRPHIVRTPVPKKPKARDLKKRDMTYDEKQKLSSKLQGLPSEKLDGVVQIIKRRNTAMFQHGDEIEMDIDNVDAETLWELDRFVLNGTMYHDLHTPTSALLPVKNRLARTKSNVDPKIHRPHIVRTPVPKKTKARDLKKRGMTYDEKQKLSSKLQGLPSEKLDGVVQIIKRRNTAMSQHGDEIEMDIDNVDAETLWELDRFVTNFKKGLSSNKRKAEHFRQAVTLVNRLVPMNTGPAVTSRQLEKTALGESGEHPSVDGQKQRNNDRRSSSSSSSSSSGSDSSSDSDSDSASADGSLHSHKT